MPDRPKRQPRAPATPSKPAPRSASRRKRERRREAAVRGLQPQGPRTRSLWIWGGAGGIAIIALVVLLAFVVRGSPAPPSPTPTASPTPVPAPVLASADGGGSGQPIDGIQCQTSEQLVHHVHAHLAVYVNGTLRTIPEGVGVAPPRQEVQSNEGPYVDGGKCFYWLHTHTNDGIIHIESPSQKDYTLGEFFDIWQQQLTRTQVGPNIGTLTLYVDGTLYTGDPRAITLTAHKLIQIDVNGNVPPASFTFPATL